jgi:hypothetical protein
MIAATPIAIVEGRAKQDGAVPVLLDLVALGLNGRDRLGVTELRGWL